MLAHLRLSLKLSFAFSLRLRSGDKKQAFQNHEKKIGDLGKILAKILQVTGETYRNDKTKNTHHSNGCSKT